MRIESADFTTEDLGSFYNQLVDQDRLALVDRLERASARLRQLAPRVHAQTPTTEGDWNAGEVLAHMVVLSKFYGVLGYRVGTGAITELDLLDQVHRRDEAGEAMAQMPAEQIAEMALSEHERTRTWLRQATPRQLERRVKIDDGPAWTAEKVIRLLLGAHLEQHLDQLERSLG